MFDMSHQVTLGFVWVPDDKVDLLFEFLQGARAICEQVDGFFSMTLWMDLDLPEKYLILAHYANGVAAQEAAARVSEAGLMDPGIEQMETPPDIRRIDAEVRHGATPGKVEVGQLASTSIRSADPGQGHELETDVLQVFEGLKYLDGYLGSMVGPNSAVRDEIVGIAFWADRRPFDQSVQRGSFYEIRLFERIA